MSNPKPEVQPSKPKQVRPAFIKLLLLAVIIGAAG